MPGMSGDGEPCTPSFTRTWSKTTYLVRVGYPLLPLATLEARHIIRAAADNITDLNVNVPRHMPEQLTQLVASNKELHAENASMRHERDELQRTLADQHQELEQLRSIARYHITANGTPGTIHQEWSAVHSLKNPQKTLPSRSAPPAPPDNSTWCHSHTQLPCDHPYVSEDAPLTDFDDLAPLLSYDTNMGTDHPTPLGNDFTTIASEDWMDQSLPVESTYGGLLPDLPANSVTHSSISRSTTGSTDSASKDTSPQCQVACLMRPTQMAHL